MTGIETTGADHRQTESQGGLGGTSSSRQLLLQKIIPLLSPFALALLLLMYPKLP